MAALASDLTIPGAEAQPTPTSDVAKSVAFTTAQHEGLQRNAILAAFGTLKDLDLIYTAETKTSAWGHLRLADFRRMSAAAPKAAEFEMSRWAQAV